MEYQLGTLAACTALFVYVWIRRYGEPSPVKDVPGPVNPSWIFGKSSEGEPDYFHLYTWADSTEYEPFKDISGISR